MLHCKVCKEPLASTDGEYALKYFLVDKSKHDSFDVRLKQTAPKRDAKQS